MKKNLFLILFFSCFIYAQSDSLRWKDLINEVEVSANMSLVFDENVKSKFGAGLGVYHTFFKPKISNL